MYISHRPRGDCARPDIFWIKKKKKKEKKKKAFSSVSILKSTKNFRITEKKFRIIFCELGEKNRSKNWSGKSLLTASCYGEEVAEIHRSQI